MIRKAFLMKVQPGKIAEYKRTHDEIWPELTAAIKKHGASNYSIFFHETSNQLFGYVELESEALWNGLAKEPVCHRWWKEMTKYLVSESPGAPKAIDDELRQIFFLK